jgi:hypothetical protein
MDSSTTLQSFGGAATGLLLGAVAGDAASAGAAATAAPEAFGGADAKLWLASLLGDAAGWTRAASFEHPAMNALRTSAADQADRITSRLDGHLELLA